MTVVDGLEVRRTVVESEWDWYEADLLIAAQELAKETGPHGFLMSEVLDPSNAGAFVGDDMPIVDFAEKARLDGMDRYYKQWPDANRNGHLFGVTKRPSSPATP